MPVYLFTIYICAHTENSLQSLLVPSRCSGSSLWLLHMKDRANAPMLPSIYTPRGARTLPPSTCKGIGLYTERDARCGANFKETSHLLPYPPEEDESEAERRQREGREREAHAQESVWTDSGCPRPQAFCVSNECSTDGEARRCK